MLIELAGLGLKYTLSGRTVEILKDVNLEVEAGEMVAILGPSGSGKSTLLYILGCLLRPTTGRFAFLDQEVLACSNEQLAQIRSRRIGFVFQQFHLLPRASVLDNVKLAAQYLEDADPTETDDRAVTLLDRFGLSTHLHHLPNQLSGGQQQRVAIARALLNEPDLILADEPTGNLDSMSAGQVLDLLQEIHRQGKTVIIITHDRDVAARCQRIVRIQDGVLSADETQVAKASGKAREMSPALGQADLTRRFHWRQHLQAALTNLRRNRTRSILTMMGVTIGIAAVLSTVTLGAYTRAKILSSYEQLGVNKLIIRAYPRWRMKASEIKGQKFEGISEVHDIEPLRKLFPEIEMISGLEQDWSIRSAEFGGRSDDQIQTLGVSAEYFPISNRQLAKGRFFTKFHEANHSRVCVIGSEVVSKLFGKVEAVGQIMSVNGDNKQYTCEVIGVLRPQESNSEWFKVNQQILLPTSYLSLMANSWYAKLYEFDLRIQAGASVEDLSTKIKNFFYAKYNRTAIVSVDSDQVLIAQMRKFLNLFAILLSAVAFISLAVGGIGITNMMLVSVSERFKEIGLRKALGARDVEIRVQFLIESVILCAIAGFSGVIFGVAGYHLVLSLASKLFPKLHFEWVFNGGAIALSVICIFAVGVASGIIPAIRAEKLEVVEALRSE